MEKKYIKIGCFCFLAGMLLWSGRKIEGTIFSRGIVIVEKQLLYPSIYDDDINELKSILFPALYCESSSKQSQNWDKVAIDTDAEYSYAFSETPGESQKSNGEEIKRGEQDTIATNSDADVMEAAAVTEPLAVSNGITYSMEQLSNRDFLIGNCYTIDGSTNVTNEELDANMLLSKDLHIDISSNEPKILIYHTHGSETFCDSRAGVTEDTVIGLGDELTRILEEDYGIPVYHDRTVYDVVDGVEDRSRAYDYASNGVDAILQQYPSIEVVLDIHRDGVRDDVRLVREIDGVPTAQIMFLNGMSRTNDNGEIDYLFNPYREENLAFSLQMHLAGKALYGDLMRRIYVRGYCFNLNKMPRSSLIEVGAQTNTVEEAKNAMVPLGAILYKVLIAQE